MENDEAPGWSAIDGALERIYPGIKPLHWGTILKWSLGGDDPLDGISAYPRTDPVPHWHVVSYGMSELYDKESDNAEESGWGFEFTFRVARKPGEDAPEPWCVNVLQNLGRYVFRSGNWFEPGHTININGPINTSREDTAIRAIAFTEDPELATISTPHGSLQFLQVVGLTLDEYEAAQAWNTGSLLELLLPRIPLYVTDIDRGSLLEDPQIATAAREGSEREGSATGLLHLDTLGWTSSATLDATVLTLGALQAPAIAQHLRGRLPSDRMLILESADSSVWLEPAETFSVRKVRTNVLSVALPPEAVEELTAALRPEAGRRQLPSFPGLAVEIAPTVMKDHFGNETGEVIG